MFLLEGIVIGILHYDKLNIFCYEIWDWFKEIQFCSKAVCIFITFQKYKNRGGALVTVQ